MFQLTGHRGRVRSLSFSADGRQLASVAGKGRVISLWDLRRRRRTFLKGHRWPVYEVAFAPGGPLLASRGALGSIKLWDTAQAREVQDLERVYRSQLCVRFTPDGRALVVGRQPITARFEVCYLDIGGARLLPEPVVQGPVPGGYPRDFAYSPAGNALAVASPTGHIDLWHLGPVRRGPHVPPARPVHALTFSPDGRLLAVASKGAVRLWDVATGAAGARLKGHTRVVTALAFTPDGRLLASASTDGLVKLWDVASGTERAAYDWQVGPVTALALAPDGMRGACGGAKGPVALWDLDL